MKVGFICLATLAQLLLAEPIQRIPFYYHQKRSSDIISAASESLKNGMLGGLVQIGNPPQNLTLAFDTSIGYTWTRSVHCNTENCENRQTYDPRNSTTAVSTGHNLTVDYGGGAKVESTIYYDTFRFAGLKVEKMPFGGAYCMEGFDQGFDGYLGLGRDINLNTSETQYTKRDGLSSSSFVPNAYQSGSGIASAQFGMYTTKTGSGFSDSGVTSTTNAAAVLNNNNNNNPDTSSNNNSPIYTTTATTTTTSATTNNAAANNNNNNNNNQVSSSSKVVTPGGYGVVKRTYDDEPDGYLVLGGVDEEAIQGDLYHIDTDDNHSGSWVVPVKEVKFKDDLEFKVDRKAKAYLSSSTDVIGLPKCQAEEFQKHWYAEYDKPDNTFKIPCCLMDRLTPLKMTLGSVKVTLPPSYWSHPRKVNSCCEMCRTHIGKSNSDKDYVIGYSFTNAFYSQFDSEKNRISFAMKKHHKQDGLKISEA